MALALCRRDCADDLVLFLADHDRSTWEGRLIRAVLADDLATARLALRLIQRSLAASCDDASKTADDLLDTPEWRAGPDWARQAIIEALDQHDLIAALYDAATVHLLVCQGGPRRPTEKKVPPTIATASAATRGH